MLLALETRVGDWHELRFWFPAAEISAMAPCNSMHTPGAPFNSCLEHTHIGAFLHRVQDNHGRRTAATSTFGECGLFWRRPGKRILPKQRPPPPHKHNVPIFSPIFYWSVVPLPLAVFSTATP
jgi:hypothetical protein